MGRAPCCDKANVKRGPWSPDEDNTLRNYLAKYGTGGNWIALPRKAGLKRCGKSCRLRWLNYLRPDIKHGGFTEDEDNIICSLYSSLGSRWSVIASRLPGRTDNDVKNYWNTKLKKKLMAGKIGLHKNSSNEITVTDSSTSNVISGKFSASIPVEDEAKANENSDYYLNANGSRSSSCMTMMKSQQNYDYPDLLLDQIADQFPLPGLMEYSTSTVNNNYSISSSQEVSGLSNSSSFPFENSYAAWSSSGVNGEDQGILLDLDFEGSQCLFSGSSFQEKSTEIAPCFGIFSSATSLSNSY